MAESSIRFAVRNSNGHRAATWKCWSPSGRDDVYLACRELGALKTSLHESGSWHVAYSPEFFEERVPEEHRNEKGQFIDQWCRPKAISPGVTLAYRIVTPWTSVTAHGDVPHSLVAVPPPNEGNAIEFDVFLIAASTSGCGWPGKASQNTKLVGAYSLPSGTSVCVVWWEIAMPQLNVPSDGGRFFRGAGIEDLRQGPLRMLAFGDEPDGSRVIFDCVGEFKRRDA